MLDGLNYNNNNYNEEFGSSNNLQTVTQQFGTFEENLSLSTFGKQQSSVLVSQIRKCNTYKDLTDHDPIKDSQVIFRSSLGLEEIPEVITPQMSTKRESRNFKLESLNDKHENVFLENERLKTILVLLNEKYASQKENLAQM